MFTRVVSVKCCAVFSRLLGPRGGSALDSACLLWRDWRWWDWRGSGLEEESVACWPGSRSAGSAGVCMVAFARFPVRSTNLWTVSGGLWAMAMRVSCHSRGGEGCKIVLNSQTVLPVLLYPLGCKRGQYGRVLLSRGSHKRWQSTTQEVRNLAETQSERSDYKSSPFVPKRRKRDTSCNHKNSMYTRPIGTKGVRAIKQGPIQKQG